jgi:hypothetical protein
MAKLDPSLRLYDNTRLSAFRKCPRYYYYRHVRHWEAIDTKVALSFGKAWHAAMEYVWPAIIAGTEKRDIMKTAMLYWTKAWVEDGHPAKLTLAQEQEYAPRTPSTALEMLVDYIDQRYRRISELEIISVEKPFVVPLDPDDDKLFYIGKMDKVVREKTGRRKVRSIEHKTTTAYKKDGKFKQSFLDSFSPNAQIDGYIYALHMTYPGEVSGVWIDGALVHRNETGFTMIPVEKIKAATDMWLWSTRYWIDQIEANTEHLKNLSPDDPYMAAFPQRTESCWDFNSACEHLLTCKAWPNPMGKAVPSGFREHKWDPLEFVDASDLLPKAQTKRRR